MNLLKRYTVLSFVLVLVSIVGQCLAQRSMTLLVVAGVLAVMSWYITEGPRGRFLPKWVSNVLVVAVSLSVVPDLWQNNQNVLGVLGRFTVWLTLIKLYEPKTARDQAQLLTLSLLLILMGCLKSSDLLFGVVLLLYIVLGLYVLLLYQLVAADEAIRRERKARKPQPSLLTPSSRPTAGRRVGLEFGVFTSGVGVVGMVLAVVVFVVFPRGSGGDVAQFLEGATGNKHAGFLDHINLDVGGRITNSRRQVMTVRVTNEYDETVEFPRSVLLRGAVLEKYDDDGVWIPGPADNTHEVDSENGEFGSLFAEQRRIATHTMHVTPQHRGSTLFTPYRAYAVATQAHRRFVYLPNTQVIHFADGEHRDAYEVQFHPLPPRDDIRALRHGRNVHPRDSQDGLESRPVRRLANQLIQLAGLLPVDEVSINDVDWKRRVVNVFMNYLYSPDFGYTLDLSGVTKNQQYSAIEQFLLETRRGHCEYFASALVALCYQVEIHARIVTGYMAHDYDDDAGQYTVLESDAHAWVEVDIEGGVWEPFDPTPPGALEQLHNEDGTFLDRLRGLYEKWDDNWTASVVEFDADQQSSLASAVDMNWSQRITAVFESVREFARDVNRFFMLGVWGYIWMGIVGLALILAVIALTTLMRRSLAMRRLFRMRHLRGREYQLMLRQLGFYLDMLKVLSRGKTAKPDWQPPMMFAHALPPQHDPIREQVSRITEMFYRARYGKKRLSREERNEVNQDLQDIAAHLGVRYRR